jgi:hypothetical protein
VRAARPLAPRHLRVVVPAQLAEKRLAGGAPAAG